MTQPGKSVPIQHSYEEDEAWAAAAMAQVMADEAEVDAAMTQVPKGEIAIDDLEPLDDTPVLPPGDGLDIVRHNVFDCVAICEDDLAAGLLLFKMIMLGRYAKLTIDGQRWYVRSRSKLCRDVRLTRHQYDRALKILKKLGFVQTQKVPFELVHVFGPFTAFRVTKSAASRLKKYVKSREWLTEEKKAK